MIREWNRGRAEIRVLDCQETTPAQVGFPGARTIARLKRRVRRKGKKTTEINYLISSLTQEELDARGMHQLKRGYWVIESRLHHPLDVTMAENQSGAPPRCRAGVGDVSTGRRHFGPGVATNRAPGQTSRHGPQFSKTLPSS